MVDWEKQGSGARGKEIQQKHEKLAASFIGRLPSLTVCVCVCARARMCTRVRDAAVSLTRREGQQRSDSSTLCTAAFLLGAPLVPVLPSPRQRGRGQWRSQRGHYSGQSLGMIRHE